MKVWRRAYRYWQANGVGALPRKTVGYIDSRWIRPRIPDPLGRRRRKLGQTLFDRSGGVVLEGPLKGFRLNRTSNWGGANYGPMVLGTYEAPILDTLVEWSRSARLLIDIGAADGYFGVGLVARGYFERAACFEIDPTSRQVLRDVARLNGVEDQISIFGAAGDDLSSQLAAAGVDGGGVDAGGAVVLCDIEGGEFALLKPGFLSSLSRSPFIIELHDGFFPDGADRLARLVADASVHFDVDFLDRGARRLSERAEVRMLPEDDRWLLCSEGRSINQRWLVLRPKAGRL